PLLELAPVDGQHHVYDEETFRYFMELDRRRAERSKGSFLLVLVEWSGQSNETTPFEPKVADRLFSLMTPCLRGTDFLGWYDQGRIAAAVLTQLGGAAGTDVSSLVMERLDRALASGFPPQVAGRLRVRVYQLPLNPSRS